MEEKVLTVGVIGAGEISSKVHLPVLRASEGVRIVYVGDTNRERAELAAKFVDAQAVTLTGDLSTLPETDAVLIATPVGTREPYYKLFAARGTAVLAEKPIASSTAAVLEASALFRTSGFSVCLQRRTFGSSEILRRVITENWFGPLLSVTVEEGARGGKTGTDERFYDKKMLAPGGILLDLGTHALDLIFHLTGGSEPKVVESEMLFDGHVDREARGKFTVSRDGQTVSCRYTFSWLRNASNTITFEFAGCSVVAGSAASNPTFLRSNLNGSSLTLEQPDGYATSVYQAFYIVWRDFLQSIRLGAAAPIPAASSVPVVALIEELYSRAGFVAS